MLRKTDLSALSLLVCMIAPGPGLATDVELDCERMCQHSHPGGYGEIDLCPADLDDDGEQGVSDLTLLLGCWGSHATDPEVVCDAADFDQDQEVGCFDLEYLIGNWGACTGADLNGDGYVNEADRDILCATLGTDCRFDLDHNGIVDQHDQNALLCLWGTSAPQGDFDSDGTVGTSDLLQLMNAFGRDCRADLDRDGIVDACYDLEILMGKWSG